MDTAPSASERIDARIAELGDWRGATLGAIRALIRQAVPDVVEEWKWRGVPVWSRGGLICTGETYRSVVKLTFAKGAALDDPSSLFNAGLDGNVRRAIDLREGETVDAAAFSELIRAAVALNGASARKPKSASRRLGAISGRTAFDEPCRQADLVENLASGTTKPAGLLCRAGFVWCRVVWIWLRG